jgi:hypothetical protein
MATFPDETLLKASGPEIDRIEGGARRWIPDPPTFNCMGLNWGAVKTISDTEWGRIPKGAPYPSRADNTLLQASDPKVYVMTGCYRHWIPDPDTFNARGYNWGAIQHVSDADLAAIPEGKQIPSVRPTLLQVTQAHQSVEQQLDSLNKQLESVTSKLSSESLSAADMLALQQAMASYQQAVSTISNVTKDISDTMDAVMKNMG